jgi:hypothetical protein
MSWDQDKRESAFLKGQKDRKAKDAKSNMNREEDEKM